MLEENKEKNGTKMLSNKKEIIGVSLLGCMALWFAGATLGIFALLIFLPLFFKLHQYENIIRFLTAGVFFLFIAECHREAAPGLSSIYAIIGGVVLLLSLLLWFLTRICRGIRGKETSKENKINKQEDSKEKVSNGVVWITSLCMSILLWFCLSFATHASGGMLIVLVVFVPLLLGLPIFHMGFALSTIQVSERYKLFLTLFFWIGLPVLLVDLMWVIQRIKQQKGFLSYVESACVLLPYLVIGYFIFINLYK